MSSRAGQCLITWKCECPAPNPPQEYLRLPGTVLWVLLYESAARVHEILALNVEDVDLPNHRARVVRKGGSGVPGPGPLLALGALGHCGQR